MIAISAMRNMTSLMTVCVFAVATTSAAAAQPYGLDGKIIHVSDGDTVTLLLSDHTKRNIRLSSIDSPEKAHTDKQTGRIGQPYAVNAGRFLADLTKGRTVAAKCYGPDKYGRDVCEIMVDGLSANRAMVEAGWAWANVAANGRYLRDSSMPAVEAGARQRRAGLWAGANPTEPWSWRAQCWVAGHCGQ